MAGMVCTVTGVPTVHIVSFMVHRAHIMAGMSLVIHATHLMIFMMSVHIVFNVIHMMFVLFPFYPAVLRLY